ncbi:hypothetical protein CASFOL_021586 [Castilleja foliolosa]|uniref:Uncharacterized protein n=1 Tax=Castilleja foliolosa TaxID=1961234 RepID=A0ABD3D147_9LAMI
MVSPGGGFPGLVEVMKGGVDMFTVPAEPPEPPVQTVGGTAGAGNRNRNRRRSGSVPVPDI